MKKLIATFSLVLGVLQTASAQFSPGHYVLKDVNLIDGKSSEVLMHYTVVIRDQYIEAVGPNAQVSIPEGAVIFDYTGKYLMPGLIDTHVHLATEPSKEDHRSRAERDLSAMLKKGITTVRDMAGDARSLASLARDAQLDDISSPDIYYTALMAGPVFFADPRTHASSQGGKAGEMPFMKAVTQETNLLLAIAEAKGTGATAIKLYAQLDGELAKKISAEAHRQGLHVWSHADLTIASPLEVINADADAISHAGMIARWQAGPTKKIPDAWLKGEHDDTFWDQAFTSLPINDYISAMQKQHTILDPTLLVYKDRLNNAALPEAAKQANMVQWQIAKRFTKLAFAKGIIVSTGTDSDENKFVQREMQILVKDAGFTPMQALISATRNGALAIGIADKVGTVEKGKIANLILLNANPVLDLANLEKLEMVIKNGKMFNLR